MKSICLSILGCLAMAVGLVSCVEVPAYPGYGHGYYGGGHSHGYDHSDHHDHDGHHNKHHEVHCYCSHKSCGCRPGHPKGGCYCDHGAHRH